MTGIIYIFGCWSDADPWLFQQNRRVEERQKQQLCRALGG